MTTAIPRLAIVTIGGQPRVIDLLSIAAPAPVSTVTYPSATTYPSSTTFPGAS